VAVFARNRVTHGPRDARCRFGLGPCRGNRPGSRLAGTKRTGLGYAPPVAARRCSRRGFQAGGRNLDQRRAILRTEDRHRAFRLRDPPRGPGHRVGTWPGHGRVSGAALRRARISSNWCAAPARHKRRPGSLGVRWNPCCHRRRGPGPSDLQSAHRSRHRPIPSRGSEPTGRQGH